MTKEEDGPAWKQRGAFGSRGEHAVASWHARWNVPRACCLGPPGVLILMIITALLPVPGALGQCTPGACIAEDTCLQSAITNPVAVFFSITICGDIVLGRTITVNRPGSFIGACPGRACLIRLGAGITGEVPLFQTNSDLTMNNLILQGGMAAYGGAVQVATSTAAVAFSNVTFQYNTAQYGGAVGSLSSAPSGNATFIRCTFQSNSATNTQGTGVYGGSVYWGGPLQIQGCNFTANTADQGGGAVFHNGSLAGHSADIRGSIFSQNLVTSQDQGFGGAIYATGLGRLALNGNSFVYNTIQGSTALTSLTFNGGAVYSESPLFAAGNIIQYNSASPAGYGGGVELAGGASIICGPFNVSSNSASQGLDYYLTRSASASFCPSLPAATAISGGNAAVSCDQCTCASGACDPNADCLPSADLSFTCTCKPGSFGNGYYCASTAPLLAGVILPALAPPPGIPPPSPTSSPPAVTPKATTPIQSSPPPSTAGPSPPTAGPSPDGLGEQVKKGISGGVVAAFSTVLGSIFILLLYVYSYAYHIASKRAVLHGLEAAWNHDFPDRTHATGLDDLASAKRLGLRVLGLYDTLWGLLGCERDWPNAFEFKGIWSSKLSGENRKRGALLLYGMVRYGYMIGKQAKNPYTNTTQKAIVKNVKDAMIDCLEHERVFWDLRKLPNDPADLPESPDEPKGPKGRIYREKGLRDDDVDVKKVLWELGTLMRYFICFGWCQRGDYYSLRR